VAPAGPAFLCDLPLRPPSSIDVAPNPDAAPVGPEAVSLARLHLPAAGGTVRYHAGGDLPQPGAPGRPAAILAEPAKPWRLVRCPTRRAARLPRP